MEYTINSLIEKLQAIKDKHGDMPITYEMIYEYDLNLVMSAKETNRYAYPYHVVGGMIINFMSKEN